MDDDYHNTDLEAVCKLLSGFIYYHYFKYSENDVNCVDRGSLLHFNRQAVIFLNYLIISSY